MKLKQLVSLFFLLASGCILFSSCTDTPTSEDSPGQSPPNILIILADDMGYSDLGCYGSEISTPNLDRLAANGMRFTQFYNAARCCPTRAALLTGLYPHQAGMGKMTSGLNSKPAPGPEQGYLNEQCLTLAEALKPAGYATYMSGKWHVGEKPEHWPRQRGFDRYFGLIGGASSYFELIKNQRFVRQMALDDNLWEPPAEGFYMTDAFTEKAVEFLDQHFAEKENPFFLYLAYTAPHWPLHAMEEDIQKYEGRYDIGWDSLRLERYYRMLDMSLIDHRFQLPDRPESIPSWETAENKADWARMMQVYAAMIDRMDQGIGKVIARLEASGQLDNTLILFLSDNGGCAENVAGRNLNDPSVPIGLRGSYVAYDEPWAYASNTPFRRYKQYIHEGGIATPFIAHWPAQIPKGSKQAQAAHVIDLMPTVLQIASATFPQDQNLTPLPGTSLLPALKGATSLQPRLLGWEHFNSKGIRDGDWKLVSDRHVQQWELYDLAKDPTELNNLAETMPEKTEELLAKYQQWAREVGVVEALEQ